MLLNVFHEPLLLGTKTRRSRHHALHSWKVGHVEENNTTEAAAHVDLCAKCNLQ
jgi:hypothetical protein